MCNDRIPNSVGRSWARSGMECRADTARVEVFKIRHLASILSAMGVAGLLFCSIGRAETPDDDLLRSLPAEEQAIKDTVDHWGLPFADQLRRFISARERFAKRLGERAPKEFFLGIQHGLEKVPRNKYWFKGAYGTSVSLEAAHNEYESFQVAVLPDIGKRLKRVSLEAQDLRQVGGGGVIPARTIRVYRVDYVQTVPASYPSLYTGLWPDRLLPAAPIQVSGTDLGLFWVEIKVPREAVPGEYRGQLSLAADGRSVPVEVGLRVHGFALPDRVPLPIAVWTSARWPSGEKMSLDDYRLLLAEFLAHGVDPVSVGKESVSLAKNDFRALDENLEFCFARGLQLFEIANPGENIEKLKPLVDHLRQKGWLSKALVYSNQDEPDARQFAAKNVPYYKRFKSAYPDLRMFLASEHHPHIDDACDIWMTDLSTGQGPAWAQQARGKAELWFYYCHLPIHIDFYRPLVQAPNMQIDNEAIEHRLAPWLAWKYRATGMFIWAGNQEWVSKDVDRKDWKTGPWRLPQKPYAFPYGGLHNGNGYLLYPGPQPSIRIKVLRDGLEDYGYLMELGRRAGKSPNQELRQRAEALLAVPPAVLMDAHYFNRNPAGLLHVRSEMARLIDALGPAKD